MTLGEDDNELHDCVKSCSILLEFDMSLTFVHAKDSDDFTLEFDFAAIVASCWIAALTGNCIWPWRFGQSRSLGSSSP